MSEINCNNCAISHFKEMLCDRCDEMKRLGSAEDIEKLIIECSPSVQPDVPDKNVGDTISRQAAIDALEFGITYAKAINKETGEVVELFAESNNELRKAVERVKALPSVQQEITDKQIAEYCRKRNLVLITHESFEILKAYYDRQNSV